jgi:LAO/AO transport system kinase
MLHLGAARAWDPPVLTSVALSGEGVEELWDAIEDHRTHLGATGALAAKRRARFLKEVESLVAERFRLRAGEALRLDPSIAEGLEARRLDPYRAAAMLVEQAAT